VRANLALVEEHQPLGLPEKRNLGNEEKRNENYRGNPSRRSRRGDATIRKDERGGDQWTSILASRCGAHSF